MANTYDPPFHAFERFFSGHHKLDDKGSTSRDEGDSAVRAYKPRMDLHEDAERNLVTTSFEFPGLSKGDVQISVHNGRLTVSADAKKSTEHDEKGYAIRERRFGRLWRTIQVPPGVEEDQIKASMKDGVLNITFPKTSPEHAPSRIAIS